MAKTTTRTRSTSRAKSSTSSKAKTTTKSKPRSTSTRKTSTSAKAVAAETPVQPAEETQVVSETEATEPAVENAEDALRKGDFIEAVVARCGVKKRDAKPAIEAAMAILGETLQGGRGINMPELGKIKVQNSKTVGDVSVINLRMRRKENDGTDTAAEGEGESDKEGLAEPAE